MANSVEDALSRASAEQRERAMQTIEEARRNIQSTTMQPGDMSSMSATSIAHNAQVIEDAKRTIPFETMQHVDEIGPPMNTPAANDNYQSNVIEIDPNTQSKIEQIQQGEGNNYLSGNAVDRAMARQPQEYDRGDQQRAMER